MANKRIPEGTTHFAKCGHVRMFDNLYDLKRKHQGVIIGVSVACRVCRAKALSAYYQKQVDEYEAKYGK